MKSTNHYHNLQHCTAAAAGGLALLVTLAAVIGSVDSTLSFRVCFGALLLTLGVAQLKLAVDLYNRRNNLLLQLFQPISLLLLTTAGAVATIASFLFAFPEYDAACALRQPLILTSITFMGNLLIGRAWRIDSNIGTTATFAAPDGEIDAVGVARLKVINVLRTLSRLGRFVGGGGREEMGSNMISVVLMLLVPQLVLQIVNLSVPSVRMESIEMISDEGHFTCESETGSFVLIFGIVLASVPFAISLLINIESKGMPDKFRELDEIAASMMSSFWMLLGTLPAAEMIRKTQPNAHAYLLAASVLSCVLPLSYNIAQTRLQNLNMNTNQATAGENSKQGTCLPRRMPRTSPDLSSLSSRDGKVQDDPLILNAAGDYAAMGKMFDIMGSTSNAVDMYKDVLTLFKVQSGGDEFLWEGGFALSEIQSLGPKSLEMVIKTLYRSSKIWQRILWSDIDNEEAERRCIKCCMDAFDVFDKAPAKSQLNDRCAIFPCYSMINAISNSIAYTPPNNMSKEDFETTLAENFVKETRHQQYHQCRALAFQADTMRRHGKYEEAVSVIDEMKSIYDPQLHSRTLVKEYVTDHCIDMVAASSFWLHHHGRNDEALQLCDQVIDTMLPEIGATELAILTPICRTLASQGQSKRALELFRTHVADPAALAGTKAHPLLGMHVIIMIILKCRSSEDEAYADLNIDVTYVFNREDPPWFEAASLSYFDAAWSTLCAEACLCLAKIMGCNSQKASESEPELIKEGIKCLEISTDALTNNVGTIVNTMAHSYYLQILSELENLSSPV